ncbi:protein translocase subunit SecF [Solimicrobium silvestre]|uniref:Protein-export membrane protein SecF n=1 Tax=Solimicrobium silvestre TaxID=2099400 RepID=A0A2S9H116_9BURK|nr:protein translocase subunit SecF [Solimicrobium silvestre]PRC93640.1 Protein-export membrane protein SecF [Solimicrobium silvestre]
MELFRIKKDIPFMRHALIFNVISALTFVAAVFFLLHRGLNLSIEFTGGTEMVVSYDQAAKVDVVKQTLEQLGFHDTSASTFGRAQDVLIRLPAPKAGESTGEQTDAVIAALQKHDASATKKRFSVVGPQVGEELWTNGMYALLMVIVGVAIYLAIRFEWKYAVSAIIANLHDVVIILGFFAFFQWEFSLSVLAGVLAVLGYSVNESVVIFDRIRENFRKQRKTSVTEVIDSAITSTISRTIITHGSTQMMVLSMYFFGGATLHGFSMALTIGICFGIYSSVFVAAAIAMWLGVKREDLIKPIKPKDETDGAVV